MLRNAEMINLVMKNAQYYLLYFNYSKSTEIFNKTSYHMGSDFRSKITDFLIYFIILSQ